MKFQVLWQGHTIQVENGDANLQGMQPAYNIQFGTVNEAGEMEVETKPKVEKKVITKKKKKTDSDSDDDVFDNKLEDNPLQVCIFFDDCNWNQPAKWESVLHTKSSKPQYHKNAKKTTTCL